jgi:orotidine-5'-phosphate decarboxylase
MTSPSQNDFTQIFDRAVAACAAAQSLTSKSAEAVTRARATRASTRRIRALVSETRQAWELADLVYSDMRSEVERVARALRESGMDNSSASATVRAHIRFILYDGGLAERDAEPVVARASDWVDRVYAAA